MDEQVWKEPETGPLADVTTTYDKALLKEFVLLWTRRQKKKKLILFCAVAIILGGILLLYGLIRKNILFAYLGGVITGIVILMISYAVQQSEQAVQTYVKAMSGDAIRIQVFPDFIASQRNSEIYVAQSKYRYEAVQEIYEGLRSFCLVLKGMFQIIDKRTLSPAQIDILRQLFTQKIGEKFKGLN